MIKPYGVLGSTFIDPSDIEITTIDEEGETDCCKLCEAHRQAEYKLADEVICPSCNESLRIGFDEADLTIVADGDNDSDWSELNNQRFYKVPVIHHYQQNPACNAIVAFKPVEIIWNANHDVYYTGGDNYIPGEHPYVFAKPIKEKIDNFLACKDSEPDLTTDHLSLWISVELEKMKIEWLKEHGFIQ